jgi:serine/threonine protein kinase
MDLPSAEFAAGAVLAGKYRVERLIGQGGMGVVVEARHVTLDDRVALKFLLPGYASHPEAAQRFLREARAAVKIKSSHVARVSDVGTLENGAPYMVMEFLDGTDASAPIAAGHRLPIPEAVDYIVQACDAISEAHSLGIIHRDIKPANLFVTRHADGSPFVKVLDFGISKIVGDGGADALTRTSATMGSALYMSPEQIRQSKSVDFRTDIYALGVTLYELLAGLPPFSAESFAALCVEVATGTPAPLAERRPDLPPDFVAVVERAFARDPAQRFQTVAELTVALSPWAPPRSQPIIERIARSAGMVPRFTSNPPPDPGRASYAHQELAGTGGSRTGPGRVAPTVAATNLDGVTSVPRATRRSLVPVLVSAVVLVLLAVVGGGFWLMKSRAAAAAAAAESATPATESAASPEPAPTPSATPAEAPKVEPKVEPSASAPEPVAEKPVVAKPVAKKVVAKVEAKKPEPAKTAPAPTPTAKKGADEVR